MEESFEIPVLYKEEELSFSARLLVFGYTHKFEVDVFGEQFFFEQDDSGDYRALVDLSNIEGAKRLDIELLKTIAAAIENILE